MSSSQTDQDVRRPVASTRGNQSTGSRDSRLSPVQVLAGALAAVSAAVIASLFGVAGTVVGAAVASVVSTVGAAIYSDLNRPGIDGGFQPPKDGSHGGTEEVPRRAA